MTQQMSGVAMSGGGPTPGTFSQPGAPTASWPAAPAASGQTLSTQLWKWRGGGPEVGEWKEKRREVTWQQNSQMCSHTWPTHLHKAAADGTHSRGSLTALPTPTPLHRGSFKKPRWHLIGQNLPLGKKKKDWQLSCPVFIQFLFWFPFVVVVWRVRQKQHNRQKRKLLDQ